MSIAAIMQPTFFPWLGYFDIIDKVDYFVSYNDVQLSRRSWQVRNRIKTANGEFYLSIPIQKTKNRDELLICEAEISYDQNWQSKHLKTIESSYHKAKYFDSVFMFISELYAKKHSLLHSFNEDFIVTVLQRIGITTPFIRSAELEGISGTKDMRLASICKKLSCYEYLSPQGSSTYIESHSPGGELTKQGISLYYQSYKHPQYHQLYGPFIPYMGVVDLLFNEGFEHSLGVIRSGRQTMINYKDFRKQNFNLD